MPNTSIIKIKQKSPTLTQILEKLKEFELALKLSSGLEKHEIIEVKKVFKKLLKANQLQS